MITPHILEPFFTKKSRLTHKNKTFSKQVHNYDLAKTLIEF